MTRRENTNNLDQYFVLDIIHTIYGSIIGMSLCVFSHNKLKNYVFFLVVCVSKRRYLLSYVLFSHMTGSDVTESYVIFIALFSTKLYTIAFDLLLLWMLLPSNFKDENIF